MGFICVIDTLNKKNICWEPFIPMDSTFKNSAFLRERHLNWFGLCMYLLD